MEAYGDGEKKVLESEKNTRKFARRSIVAKSLILKNETLTRENLTQKDQAMALNHLEFMKF